MDDNEHSIEHSIDRRTIQRDWYGHSIFAIITAAASIIGTTLLLSLPLIAWSNDIGQKIAVQGEHETGTDKQLNSLQMFESTVSTQLATFSAQLAVLSQKIDDMEKKPVRQ